MIDFVRLQYKDKSKIEPFVCNQENFDELLTELEYHSGEIRYPYKVKIGSMELCINEKSAYLKNSIHKLYNEMLSKRSHNHNDFTYSDLVSTINYLDSKLTDIKATRLTQLEFGLNLKLSRPAEEVISKNIILHNLALHNHNEQFGGRGEYKQFNHYNYYFKIYDKAKHFNLKYDLIRFELKYKNSKGFNPFGVFNINDLKKKSCLKRLFNDLLKRFDELVIIDEIPSKSIITREDTILLERYTSFNYWEKLSERKNRNIKSRERMAFQKLLEKNDLLKTKNILRKSLILKFDELINK